MDNKSAYPIHLAADKNHYLSAKYLLENGAKEQINKDGNVAVRSWRL
ncbi:MAG: hypothetical protein AB8V23_03715 [Candidatus Midichloria sp.]